MGHPKDIGDRTTLAVMLALHEPVFQVSMPFGANTRYDLVLDDGEKLTRLQCKTGSASRSLASSCATRRS